MSTSNNNTPLANANRAATWYRERMLENEEWCERFVNALQRIGDATPEGARHIARSLLDDWHNSSTFAEDDLLPQKSED